MQQSRILRQCKSTLLVLLCAAPTLLWAQPANYIKNESQFFNHVVKRIVYNHTNSNIKFAAGIRFNYDSVAKSHNNTSVWVGRLQEDSTINQIYYYRSSERWLTTHHVALHGDSLFLYCRSINPSALGIGDEMYIKTYIFNLQTNQFIDSIIIDVPAHLGIDKDTLILARDEMPCNIIPTTTTGDSLIVVGSILNRYNGNTMRYNSYYFVISKQGEVIWEIPSTTLDSAGTSIQNPLASGAYFQNQFVAFSYTYSAWKFIFRFNKQAIHTFTGMYDRDQCDYCFKMPVTTHVYKNNLYAIGMIAKDRADFLQVVKYDSSLAPIAFRTLDNRMPGTQAVYYTNYLSAKQFSTIDNNGNIYVFYTYVNGNMNVVKLNSNLDIIWRKYFDVNQINWGVSHQNLTIIENKIYLYGNYCNDLDFTRDFPCSDSARHAYIYVIDTSGFITNSPVANGFEKPTYYLYPNPTSGNVYLENIPLGSIITLYDIEGKAVSIELVGEEHKKIQITKKGMLFYTIQDKEFNLIGKGKLLVQ
jgi:hypothetical protein